MLARTQRDCALEGDGRHGDAGGWKTADVDEGWQADGVVDDGGGEGRQGKPKTDLRPVMILISSLSLFRMLSTSEVPRVMA